MPNLLIVSIRAGVDASGFTIKIRISSAYGLILCWLFATVNPQMLVFILIASALRRLIAKANKRGGRGQTCLEPLLTLAQQKEACDTIT